MKAVKFIVSLPVADLQQSQMFYRALGLEPGEIEENILTLELPGLSLFLIQQEEFESYSQKAGAAALRDSGTVGSILTYGLQTAEELQQLLEKAEAAGGTVVGPAVESWGHTGYFRDPDGHLWELVWNEKMRHMPLLPVAAGATAAEPEVTVNMLIRKPVDEVFEAWLEPEAMTKFWYTHSSGRMEEGKTLLWKWEQFGAEGKVQVKQVLKNEFISFTWPDDATGADQLVEISFEPKPGNSTYVCVRETGFNPADPQLTKKVAGQTQGWALVLAALKAYLEHGLVLPVVTDHYYMEPAAAE